MAEHQNTSDIEAQGDGRTSSRDKDSGPLPGEPRQRPKRRRKVSYLTANKIEAVDYKEVSILRRFVNDRGKILPSRQTGNTARQQRMIASAIRRARELALLPFVIGDVGPERREFGGRGFRGDRSERGERPERSERAEREHAPSPAAEAPAPAITAEASEQGPE